MKNKKKVKNKNKLKAQDTKLIKEFIAFGNRKKVFWSITISVILLTIIGVSIAPENRKLINYFSLIWIIESIYIWMYLETKKKYNFK